MATPPPRLTAPTLLGSAVGGTLYGIGSGGAALSASALDPGLLGQCVLILASAAVVGGAATVLTAPLLLALNRLPENRAPALGPRTAGTARFRGFLAGISLASLVDLGEVWFTRPDPFSPGAALQGHPGIFLLALGAGAALCIGLPMVARSRRARMGVVLAAMAALYAYVVGNERDPGPRGPPTDGPNLLMVTLDTCRADHIGAYDAIGERHSTTPAFDRVSSEGARFEHAMAQIPVTGPSHTTLFTGLGPWTHGGLLNGVPVRSDLPLLAERLRARGYRTGAFVSAYVLGSDIGLDRGFEVYNDEFGWLVGWSRTLGGRVSAWARRRAAPDQVLERRGERTTTAALAWLDRNASEPAPFFAWIHLFDPHGPYEPPPPWDTAYYEGDPRDPAHSSMAEVEGVASYLAPSLQGITDAAWVLAQYQGEVSYADEQLGRVLDWLDAAGLTDETLVVVAGDHGESLGEHGVWFNHGDDLFEAASHVPLALRLPGRVPEGTLVDAPVELTDVVPTVLRLLGAGDGAQEGDGQDLEPALFGARPRGIARSITFDRLANQRARSRGEIHRPKWRMVALRGPDFRYVYREAPGLGEVYYDLGRDPNEREPSAVDDETLGPLRAHARALLSTMSGADLDRASREVDPETKARLEQLGYLD